MRIYYNVNSITDNCKNMCPFIKTESDTTPMVGSCYCKHKCKYCYGYGDKIGFIGYPNSDDNITFHYPTYIKCMYGYNEKTKYKVIRFFKKLFHLI